MGVVVRAERQADQNRNAVSEKVETFKTHWKSWNPILTCMYACSLPRASSGSSFGRTTRSRPTEGSQVIKNSAKVDAVTPSVFFGVFLTQRGEGVNTPMELPRVWDDSISKLHIPRTPFLLSSSISQAMKLCLALLASLSATAYAVSPNLRASHGERLASVQVRFT
eukprot:Selendium_serpulae@DN6496_c1_g1_i12.p1